MKKITCRKGEVIFRQGESGSTMYEILGGRIGIYLNYREPEEKQLTVLGKKRYFGELAVIDRLPHSATAVAEEAAELIAITPETLEEYLQQNPSAAVALMKNMSYRFRQLTGEYMEACRMMADFAETAEKSDEKPGLLAKLKKYINHAKEQDFYDSGSVDWF